MERIRFDQKGYKEYFDAVEKLLPLIMNQVKPAVCLEIGSGSGFVINSIAKNFGSQISKY